MSYDVTLRDAATGATLRSSERFEEGGTYALGGTDECWLNITYNYTRVFGSLVHDLHGKVARDTVQGLQAFVDAWPDATPDTDDYWAPTPGNAKAAIERLCKFAAEHPDGVWEVSG